MPRLFFALGTALALMLAPSVSLAYSGDSATGNTNYGDSHIEFTATSNRDGSNPSGPAIDLHFNGLHDTRNGQRADVDVWGHVTCLNASGNKAAVGFVVDTAKWASDQADATGQMKGKGMVLYVQDGGSDASPDWFSNSAWVTAAQASTGSSVCQPQALGPGNAGYYPGNAFQVSDK